MNHRSPVPPMRIPNVVPFRAMEITALDCGTSDAQSSAAFAAAIATFRKKRWLAERKRATSTARGVLAHGDGGPGATGARHRYHRRVIVGRFQPYVTAGDQSFHLVSRGRPTLRHDRGPHGPPKRPAEVLPSQGWPAVKHGPLIQAGHDRP